MRNERSCLRGNVEYRVYLVYVDPGGDIRITLTKNHWLIHARNMSFNAIQISLSSAHLVLPTYAYEPPPFPPLLLQKPDEVITGMKPKPFTLHGHFCRYVVRTLFLFTLLCSYIPHFIRLVVWYVDQLLYTTVKNYHDRV